MSDASARGGAVRTLYPMHARRAALLLALVATSARADDADSVMYRDPELPLPRVVHQLPSRLPALWVEALGRPEADLKAQAAQAVARAHERGIAGMHVAVPALSRELDRPDAHPTVRLAAARALVVLDAKESAAALARAATADADLHEFADPALAGWDYKPARAAWLDRIARPPTSRGFVHAVRALGVVREPAAATRLRDLALDRTTPAAVRLEAARALAEIRTTGSEADARALAAGTVPDRLVAAALLRRHGPDAVKGLQALGRDADPAVAAVALARLVELDPGHVLPLLDAVLASPDSAVRGFGVEVLHRRPSAPHVRLLADRLSDPHPAVRRRARLALHDQAKDWKAAVIGDAERVLAGSDWRGLEQATLLLADLEHRPAAPRMLELLRHDRPEVLTTAAWGLRRLAEPGTLAPALGFFEQRYRGLSSPNPTNAAADVQLSHLAQFFGRAKYQHADEVLRKLATKGSPAGNPAGAEARAAAAWALGLIHEGKGPPAVVTVLEGRLSAVNPGDLEDERVRQMAAVALGRMRAGEATLRRFYTDKRPGLNPVNNACGWALERVAGERYPAPGTVPVTARDWFLTPLD
ncbi:MAG: hypothetical protein U0804_01855 [Gemmataceae bacterium]